jgi:hypothetical protein
MEAIVYELQVDAPYFRTLIDRYYRQRSLFFRLPTRFACLAMVLIGAYLWKSATPMPYAVAESAIFALALVLVGVALTKLAILHRFKRRPDFGTRVTVTLLKDGLSASSQNLNGKWGWASYPRSVRYRDGILLLRAGVVRWLPDLSITHGTVGAATDLVASKTTLRRLG